MPATILFVLTPVILAGWSLWRRPRYRRIRPRSILIYLVVITAGFGAAMLFVASQAAARVPPFEVAVVVWFVVACRLAWTVWRDEVGGLGERWVRWARRRRRSGRAVPLAVKLIRPARAAATLTVLVPALLSFVLTHRFKLTDGQDPMSIFGVRFEPVRIATADGLTLDGWFIPQPGATRTIMICHGAGANKGNFVTFLPPLIYHGYNVVFFDFRAHGGSAGRTCTYGLIEHRDVLAVVDWLKRERPAAAGRIVGLGSSQGAMALMLAAARDPRIDAVILDSPYVSPRELGLHHVRRVPVVGLLLGPPFAGLVLWEMSLWTGADFMGTSAQDAMRMIGERPVLVIHGDGDVLMPASHAQRLYDAARGPRAIWFGPGSHSNIVTENTDEYGRRVFEFLDRWLGPATNRAAASQAIRPSGR